MMKLQWIQEQIKSGRYLWSLHADQERRNDGFEIAEVEAALSTGKIVEAYPNDPRGSSCLIAGEVKNVPIHVVCGTNRLGMLVIITVYKPHASKWETPTERKRT